MVSGVLLAASITRQDFTLFIASLSLGVGSGSYSILFGFAEAFFDDPQGFISAIETLEEGATT